MRAVIQKVSEASVAVSGKTVSSIKTGLLVFAAFEPDDSLSDIRYIGDKIRELRIFQDDEGKMNLSISDTGGEILVVSQFTLYGDCRKGRRPSFTQAAPPVQAENLYNRFIEYLESKGTSVKSGVFQAMMAVKLINDGPVTFMLDSRRLF